MWGPWEAAKDSEPPPIGAYVQLYLVSILPSRPPHVIEGRVAKYVTGPSGTEYVVIDPPQPFGALDYVDQWRQWLEPGAMQTLRNIVENPKPLEEEHVS